MIQLVMQMTPYLSKQKNATTLATEDEVVERKEMERSVI